MTLQKQEAAAPTAAPKTNRNNKDYQNSGNQSSRKAKIAKRRAQIPRAYRAVYDKATKGQSLRAAINSQCLECVCWQIEEIRNCTDLACPLYAVRPYQSLQNGRDGRSSGVESQNSGRKVIHQEVRHD